MDFENATFHNLTITATDVGGTFSLGFLFISITDEQEPPIINNLPSDVSIDETVLAGPTVLFTVDVYEPEGDALQYTLVAEPDDGRFIINETSM